MRRAGLNWNWTYEALAMGFVHAADVCALHLRAWSPVPEASASAAAFSTREPAGATALWEAVLRAWGVYNSWLNRVIGVSRRLVECVSAERAAEMMARGRPDTPTLYDSGKAAFRSQVPALARLFPFFRFCQGA